jgi:RNA polymerase sigma-70 factor, ECF subfamily
MLGAASMVANFRGISVGTGPVVDARPSMPANGARSLLSTAAEFRFRQIVEIHFDFVWRSLRGLGVPRSLIDDAAQQVFWIAARKLHVIVVGSERAFLFATTKGVASNMRRSESRRREDLNEDALIRQEDDAPTPEQAAVSNQARRLLERLLDKMPEDLRTAFVLFELEGLTTSAIAELLGIPMGTVASRLRRAREMFDRETARLQIENGHTR